MYTCASHSRLFTWTHEWAGAHWWLRLALVRNGREEISPHPFHRDPFLPPFSPTFLLGRAYAVLRMCDPPLLLQSQHCSKDQSSSGSDTVHLPVGGRRKGIWERKNTFNGVTLSFHTIADKKPPDIFERICFPVFVDHRNINSWCFRLWCRSQGEGWRNSSPLSAWQHSSLDLDVNTFWFF